MERTTRAQLDNMVANLNKRLNRPQDAFTNGKFNIGCFTLDHNPTYGGYQLAEIDNEHGGERTHFSGTRFTANQMWWMLYAIKEVTFNHEFQVAA